MILFLGIIEKLDTDWLAEKTMKITPPIWLAFTVLFFCFSLYHFSQLSFSIPSFTLKPHKGNGTQFYNPKAIENRANLTGFINQWNKYVNQQNRISFWLNIFTAITYLISAFMSFISSGFVDKNKIKKAANYCCGTGGSHLK